MAVTEASHAASESLDNLYRRHGGEVYRYALAVLGNHADAEDVTQTTFLNAYRALEQGVRPRKPANWLLTIASNAIKQRFRQEQSRPRQVELDRDVPARAGEDDGPTVGELLTALSKIPPQQRQAIVLREFEGRSYNEIAEIIGVTTSALETLLFRARRSLTEELAQQLTCTEAQQAVSRAADGRLGRKEKRRLQEHLTECPDCAQFARLQQRHRTAFRGLALVPIPLSLTLFKGFEGSAAAATLPAAAGAALGGGAAGTAAGTGIGGGAVASGGGIFAGGLAAKAAAVVAAASVAGGVTVVGVKEVGVGGGNEKKGPAATQTNGHGTGGVIHSRRSNHASARGLERGKAIARGQTGATPVGHARGAQKRANGRTRGARAAVTSSTRGSTQDKVKTALTKKPSKSTLRATGKPDHAGRNDTQSADSAQSGTSADTDSATSAQSLSRGNAKTR
jgi:RNA polymerase sigma factor (sigma-70 family)